MLITAVTTIQAPTPSVVRLARRLGDLDARLVVAGDTKGPARFELPEYAGLPAERLTFLDIDAQARSGFQLADILPTKHYARKNIAYLEAMRQGATCIYETDDDNAPADDWQPRVERVTGVVPLSRSPDLAQRGWINVYRYYADELIWPRGLPLDEIQGPLFAGEPMTEQVRAPVQQGLANGAPDVDAIWRLVLDREFRFRKAPSVLLPAGQWCPFNTQSTWWWPAAYPLLYIPSYCSFRMCDIWKSLVAQRCLWELDAGVVFHAAEVVQQRNPHHLMRDFEDEIPGYVHNRRMAELLESLDLQRGRFSTSENLRHCYENLVCAGLFPEQELLLVDAWISDLSAVLLERSTAEMTDRQ